MSKQFHALSTEAKIGPLTLRNRMLVTAMGTNLSDDNGEAGEKLKAFHERQAQGGAGLIVVGVVGVAWPRGGNLPRQCAISDDQFIPGLKELTSRVQKHGAKIAAQLHHAGVVATEDQRRGYECWVPSIPVNGTGDFMADFLHVEFGQMIEGLTAAPELHVMTLEDIDELVAQFGQAARRAREAGFNAIELHGGHGYIISEFLSPRTNQRDDDYGGSLENRARLLLRIISAVKAEIGSEMAVWCKLDSSEFGVDEGIGLADAIATAKLAEEAGVDAITVSSYHDTSQGHLHSGSNIPHPPEHMVDNAKAIRAAVGVPVIASGRVEPESADKHIQHGHFDFLAMGRKMLADPDLPNKIMAGQAEDIRPCVYCYCCASQIYIRKNVKCAVNPETGRENQLTLLASDQSRHIAVIGGGPAGMEAAIRLRKRGHKVSLWEKGPRLGGTLQFASIAYEPNERLLKWLRRQVAMADISVCLNTEATPETLSAAKVDEVVVATGATRKLPPIVGAEQPFVFSGDEMRSLMLGESLDSLNGKIDTTTATMARLGALTGLSARGDVVRQLTRWWLPLGPQIVIIGAELVGLELAEFLAERGLNVTVIDEVPRAGEGLYIVRRMRILHELREMGVSILLKASAIEIENKMVSYTNYRGQQRRVDCDHVIVAQGATADLSVLKRFEDAGYKCHSIGDSNGVSYIEGAIESAAELAARL